MKCITCNKKTRPKDILQLTPLLSKKTFLSNPIVTTDVLNCINGVPRVDYSEADLLASHEMGEQWVRVNIKANVIAKCIYFS